MQSMNSSKENVVMEQGKKLFSKELLMRTISALILAPVILWIIAIGGFTYKFTVLIIAILMAFEWNQLTSQHEKQKALWKIVGLGYIGIPCLSLLFLREQANGVHIIYWMLAIIWATDIGAYFAGSIIGGPKIAPKISPKKTWSGLVGGVLCAVLVGYIAATIMKPHKPEYLIILSFILSLYAQIGDLVESFVKRYFGVKDTGSIIPGHGGILDRVDSLVPVAPKVALVCIFDHFGVF